MSNELIDDTRRQIEICNACRYCEGYCSVFPAITRHKTFSIANINQLANLCHNCRGCYYACQFTEPHEYAINLPRSFAQLRKASWQQHAWPGFLARLYSKNATVICVLLVLAIAILFALVSHTAANSAPGFYQYLSHSAMVALFLPAFVLPCISVGISIRRYWRHVGGEPVRIAHLRTALTSVATMKELDGGHGEGCNFEDTDRFSNQRRWFHQYTLYGFLACFVATSLGTVYHYLLDYPAPYPFFSLPKLFGVFGGIALCIGTAGLLWLKRQSDDKPADSQSTAGEYAFTGLLFAVSATGLALYVATGSSLVSGLLALHLGAVLAFFLLLPYSKMVHGFYRLAALVRDAQLKES
jgi:citrate/tricarballylate utilization protein